MKKIILAFIILFFCFWVNKTLAINEPDISSLGNCVTLYDSSNNYNSNTKYLCFNYKLIDVLYGYHYYYNSEYYLYNHSLSTNSVSFSSNSWIHINWVNSDWPPLTSTYHLIDLWLGKKLIYFFNNSSKFFLYDNWNLSLFDFDLGLDPSADLILKYDSNYICLTSSSFQFTFSCFNKWLNLFNNHKLDWYLPDYVSSPTTINLTNSLYEKNTVTNLFRTCYDRTVKTPYIWSYK